MRWRAAVPCGFVCVLGLIGLAPVSVAAAAPEQTPRPPLTRGLADPEVPAISDTAAAPAPTTAPTAPTTPGAQATASQTRRLRPVDRPASPQLAAVLARSADLQGTAPLATPRPATRSPELVQQVLFARAQKRRGAVCGDVEIQGVEAGRIAGKLKGCGAEDAVRIRAVAGVQLSTPALLTCDTARALRDWVAQDVETAFGRANRVVRLRVAAHYSCRTRNNRPGARISEHGRGRAIDISGFTLADGTTVSVLKGWRDKPSRGAMRQMWKAACGPFRTVLGPEADIYHRDHFHLDTARHRSGRYCR